MLYFTLELDTKCMPMYNLPDVYSTTSTVPSTANLQVVAACSVWLSVNTGSQSWFNTTFNSILVTLWRPLLLVKEAIGPGENPRPVISH
jgi:hypothetical protein